MMAGFYGIIPSTVDDSVWGQTMGTGFARTPQPGFIVVIEQLPNTQKFDKEARETLLDVFRDAADYWAEKKVPFRVFYSFE